MRLNNYKEEWELMILEYWWFHEGQLYWRCSPKQSAVSKRKDLERYSEARNGANELRHTAFLRMQELEKFGQTYDIVELSTMPKSWEELLEIARKTRMSKFNVRV